MAITKKDIVLKIANETGIKQIDVKRVVQSTLDKITEYLSANQTVERQSHLGKTSRGSLESLFAKVKASDTKELRLVLKADVQGSLEAVAQAVTKLSTQKVKVEIVHKAVGAMTESDVRSSHMRLPWPNRCLRR